MTQDHTPQWNNFSDAEKRSTVLAIITRPERTILEIEEGTHRQALLNWFLPGIIELLDDAGADGQRSNPASQWLLSGRPVVLHEAAPAENIPLPHIEISDGAPTRLHLYMGSHASAKQQFTAAMQKVLEQELKKPEGEEIVAELESKGPEKGEKRKKNNTLKGVKGRYDIHKPKVRKYKGERLHNVGDLFAYANMRMGSVANELTEKEFIQFSHDFEDDKAIHHGMYEKILGGPAAKLIWQKLHNELVDENTIHNYNPRTRIGDWFRDMCVVHGVSTPILEEMTSLTQFPRALWGAIQNNDESPKIAPRRLSEMLRWALSLYLDNTLTRGIARSGTYTLPAGALFGLPLEERLHADGSSKTCVDPEAVEKLLKAVLQEKYIDNSFATKIHQLDRLEHLSKAYQEGAISKESLGRLCIPHNDVKCIYHVSKYRFPVEDKRYKFLLWYLNGNSNKINAFIDWFKAANVSDKWEISQERLEKYIAAFQRFPKGKFMTGMANGLSPDEAFEFAQHHHNGTVGGFLKIYRLARDRGSKDIGKIIDRSHINVGYMENGKIQVYKIAINHPGNPWGLPVDNGEIRSDVKEFIEKIHKGKEKAPRPDDRWVSVGGALFELAETYPQFDPDVYTDRAIMGVHTKALQPKATEVIKAACAASLEEYPKEEEFRLITLPNGKETLVWMKDGEPKLLKSEKALWQDALLEIEGIKKAMRSDVRGY